MMMKKSIIMSMAALLLSATAAQGQSYTNSRYYNERTGHLDYSQHDDKSFFRNGVDYYGLRIGPSFSTVNSDDPTLDGGSSLSSINLGAVAGLSLSNSSPLFLEGGLYYIKKGGKTLYEGKKMTYNLNYIEVPVTVKYVFDMTNGFTMQPYAGGYIAYGVGGKIRNYGDRVAVNSFSKQYFKRFDSGLRFGIGVGYNQFYAELNYDLGLTNICHDEFDTSHNGCLLINFGVNF